MQITDQSVHDKIGAKRFKNGIEFQKQLLSLTRKIQDQLLQNLPSNYSKDRNTNLSEFFRAVAKEFARLQISASDINEDKYHTETRTEYLFQVLGDTLFLGEKAINENLNDAAYRNFLLKVRNAYYEGSRKQNIEGAVSDILGLPVTIRELYLEIRKQSSFYGLKDTHTMFFDILMDDVSSSSTIGIILEDLKFFIDLIKPAHTLYDTRLIWTDSFQNRNQQCKPAYIMQDMEYQAYDTSRIYLVTYLATKIYKYSGVDPAETWTEGTIQAINFDRGIFFLVDGRILVYNSITELYVRVGSEDQSVLPQVFSVGDVIKYYASKDASGSSDLIDSTWQWSGVINDIYMSDKMITLTDGSAIIYNDDTLVYTRDYYGEYRIEIEDLSSNREIAFKADKYNQAFDFYRVPSAVQDDYFRQFDSTIIQRPSFQEYVKKEKEIPPGTVEGVDVYIENGQAVIKDIQSRFYKRANASAQKEIKVDNYTLSIDGEVQKQFELDDAPRTLTTNEAKSVFINAYGYTGLQDPNTNYEIGVAHTGRLSTDGPEAFVQAIGDHTEMCDRKASCQLVPFYEDTRKYWTWPDLQLTSGFFDITHDFPEGFVGSGLYDIPAWYYLSSDPNTYIMPYLPMLGSDGLPADASDVTVYVNGKRVDNAIESIDPWNGIVSLNFIPPFDTRLRIDYYFSKRYPNPVFYLKQAVPGTVHAVPNNLPGLFSVITPAGSTPRLTWPFEVTDPSLLGDDRDYQMNKFPMLNNKGELASKEDLSVFVGSIVVSGTVRVIDISSSESTLLNVTGEDWTGVTDGDVIIISAPNYLDNTLIYAIQSVNLLENTIVLPSALPVINAEYGYTIVNFVEVDNAVDDLRPLLGHVRLNFLLPVNSFIRINYHYTPQLRNYLMLPDAVAAENPDQYGSSSYTPDTFYGPRNNYTMLVDQNPTVYDEPFWDFDELLKIGYRYRAFNLAHSSVLNSERLLLNAYEGGVGKASFANRPGVLNQFDLMFSPEYLYDTDKNVVFNDKYLLKELPPVTVLNPGTPLFAKSFTDDGHHTIAYHAHEHDTYDPNLPNGMDLPAAFTIIDPDDSGLIDYNPVCEMPKNHQINLYSDLKHVAFPNSGFDASLQTIDEGGTAIPFRFSFIDQYYPNRELRLTEYIDYINQVPSEYKNGSLRVLNGSNVVKSIEKNFLAMQVGDIFTIKDIPYQEDINGTLTTVLKDQDYVIVEIIDFETVRVHKNFRGSGGTYHYVLSRSKVYAVDVYLNEVTRVLVINGEIDHSYSIPDTIRKHLPGYGITGMHYELYFPDSDPDPTPSNPDNPWIPNPTGISYYNVGEIVVDGKTYRSNRTQGTTGVILTSQIIDYEGLSYGYTGSISGYTGPSGALDLGITGPIGDANPRILKPSDSYIIPSGDTGTFLSYSESEYRVQWRNWDQDMLIIGLGVTGGIMVEDPINMMDDIGEGIKRSFWDVNLQALRELRFQGTVVESSEEVLASVAAPSYPNGLILLSQDDVDEINAAVELPALHLNDPSYRLHRRIIREILHDESIRITEIQEFKPVS